MNANRAADWCVCARSHEKEREFSALRYLDIISIFFGIIRQNVPYHHHSRTHTHSHSRENVPVGVFFTLPALPDISQNKICLQRLDGLQRLFSVCVCVCVCVCVNFLLGEASIYRYHLVPCWAQGHGPFAQRGKSFARISAVTIIMLSRTFPGNQVGSATRK